MSYVGQRTADDQGGIGGPWPWLGYFTSMIASAYTVFAALS
jgi:hypothetical protein